MRWVFFDAGETLLCPQPSFPELVARVLGDAGHRVGAERVLEAWRTVAGSGPASRFRRLAEEGRTFSTSAAESRAFWESLYRDVLEGLGIRDGGLPSRLYETFSDPASYGLYPDSRPALEELRSRGLRLGVISNFEAWLVDLLDRLGVSGLLEVVAVSGVVGYEKPDRRIFTWAIERAGARPAECVMVGDQPYFDCEAALAAGMRAVLLDRHGRFADLQAPYPRIGSLTELGEVVGRW